MKIGGIKEALFTVTVHRASVGWTSSSVLFGLEQNENPSVLVELNGKFKYSSN